MKYWEYHGINLTVFHKKKNNVDSSYTVEISKINIGQRDFVKSYYPDMQTVNEKHGTIVR